MLRLGKKQIKYSGLVLCILLLSADTGFSEPLGEMPRDRVLLAQTSEANLTHQWLPDSFEGDTGKAGKSMPAVSANTVAGVDNLDAVESSKDEKLLQKEVAGDVNKDNIGKVTPEKPEDKNKEKLEDERLKRIHEAVDADKSIVAPRKTSFDFNNQAITLGEPYLAGGAFQDYGLSWFGDSANSIRPRLQFYGILSTGLYGGRIAGEDQGQLSYNVEFDANLDLTNTERFHVRYQPFVDIDEPQSSGLWRFHNDSNQPDHNLKFNTDSIFAWFEGDIGEMFDFLDPEGRFPADLNIAVGLVPLVYQDGYLLNDNVLGVILAKPNLVFPGTTRVNIQAVAGFDQINAANSGATDKNDTNLFGVTAQIDAYKKYFELNYLHLQNKENDSLSQNFFAGSLVSSYGLYNYALRAMFNTGDPRSSGNGQLFVFDVNHPVFISDYYDKNYVYASAFYGTEGWNDISQGRTGRAGILFRGNGSTNFPVLRNTGTDSIGTSLGLKMFFMREVLSVNPEFSYLKDKSPTSNDQYAFGTELQYIISNHLSMVSKLVIVSNEIRSEDWGSFTELRFKF
jgi:hypothetical protein